MGKKRGTGDQKRSGERRSAGKESSSAKSRDDQQQESEKREPTKRKSRHKKEVKQEAEEKSIRASLREKGLDLYDVTGDGNCLFRALSHQLYGSEIYHHDLRSQVVNHVKGNEDDFRPFLEDDEPWERYVRRMYKEGQWAGNIELVAAGQVFKARIVVHQVDGMNWEISCGDGKPERDIHLVYMCGEHYDSVKKIDTKVADVKEDRSVSQSSSSKEATSVEKMIMSSTGCSSLEEVRRLLSEMHQDSGKVIEHLLNHEDTGPPSENSATRAPSKDGFAVAPKLGVDAETMIEFATTKGIKGVGPHGKLSNKQKRKLAKQIEDEGFKPSRKTKPETDIGEEFNTLSI
eukprot:gb/GECG01006151.1/.p1 GENE.gb/GECG01006151.1/~~gb/GECG01006151.1/.p1  ORF type:complete len:346 (+),score=54.55 gb/GECG01006151.1/:1-1038(+)